MDVAKFKRVKEEKEITNYKLEQLTGISRSVLTRYENGEVKNPSIKNIIAIAKALGVEITEII